MLRLSLRQLECFVATAQAGTITGGAELCEGSPAAVSLAINELEKRLGVQLLIRRKAKGIALTEAGARVLADARALLDQAAELSETARTQAADISGELSLGCYTTLTTAFVPTLLDEFASRYPLVRLNIIDGSQTEIQEMLLGGECELALAYERGLAEGLKRTTVRSHRPYAVVGADHRLAGASSVRLADLASEPMITLNIAHSQQRSEEVLTDVGLTPDVRYRTSNMEVLRCLVARGLGYAVLIQPWPTATSCEGDPVLAKPIIDRISDHKVVLASVEGARLTRRAQALAAFCIERFRSTSEVLRQ